MPLESQAGSRAADGLLFETNPEGPSTPNVMVHYWTQEPFFWVYGSQEVELSVSGHPQLIETRSSLIVEGPSAAPRGPVRVSCSYVFEAASCTPVIVLEWLPPRKNFKDSIRMAI